MGVGFKVGGSGGFKSFIVVTANAGETITIKKSDDASITQTLVATGGTATFTIKKKGKYNISSTDGSTASVDAVKSNEAYTVTCAWSSTITATANSNIVVTAKSGSYSVSKTTGSSGTTNTAVLTVKKKGTYTVTSADGASTTVSVAANGTNYAADVILLSYIAVTGNPGFTVTATLDSYSVSGTLNSKGAVTIPVRRLGTYTVASADGSSNTVKVTADGGTYNVTTKWSSTVTITTNPSAKVTLTKNNDSTIKYSATANASTGIASVSVLCKGTYNISSDNNASYAADGNATSVAVTGATASARFVKLNIPGSITVNANKTNALVVYWTRPSAHWTGCNVRYNANSTTPPSSRNAGTDLVTGAGGTVYTANHTAVTGYEKTGLNAGQNYAFAAFSYITINSVTYWCTTSRTATGKPVNYVGQTQTITASNASWKVPNGWYKLRACIVGGGGGGGCGGAGGGGGYVTNTGDITVTPGQTLAITIGDGGSAGTSASARAGTGGQTKFGSNTANGGTGGIGKSGAIDYSTEYGGGSGGSGGGGVVDGTSFDATGDHSGGDGGTNGGDGQTTSNREKIDSGIARRYGGKGQGTTTKAFGEGTAYAGGGGGGTSWASGTGGTGGAYGGGTGGQYTGSSYTNGTAGTANSGGGGGGGANSDSPKSGGKGGSGVVIVKCVA